MENKLFNYNAWNYKKAQSSPADYQKRIEEMLKQFYGGVDEADTTTSDTTTTTTVNNPFSWGGENAPAPSTPLVYRPSPWTGQQVLVPGVSELKERVEQLENLVAELQDTIEKLNNQINSQGDL